MTTRIEQGRTASDRNIIKEANSYGLEVLTNNLGYTQFRDSGAAKAWMAPAGGRKWTGYDGTNSYTGFKAQVADWCIDKAANGA